MQWLATGRSVGVLKRWRKITNSCQLPIEPLATSAFSYRMMMRQRECKEWWPNLEPNCNKSENLYICVYIRKNAHNPHEVHIPASAKPSLIPNLKHNFWWFSECCNSNHICCLTPPHETWLCRNIYVMSAKADQSGNTQLNISWCSAEHWKFISLATFYIWNIWIFLTEDINNMRLH